MAEALRLARDGRPWGRELPSAAICVADGCVVGAARVAKGNGIAEAVGEAGAAAKGSTVYATILGPTAAAAARAASDRGVRRLVVGIFLPETGSDEIQGCRDAIAELTVDAGGEDVWGAASAALISRAFHRPFVVAKMATSLDGRIATATGQSQWITGPEARRAGHAIRRDVGAIVVGTRTVLADDPSLTTRLADAPDAASPLRVVVSTHPSLPPNAALRDTTVSPTVVFHAVSDVESEAELRRDGVETVLAAGSDGRVDPDLVLADLFGRGIGYVLLEGGGGLHWTFLSAGLVDRTVHFVAPIVLGGDSAPTAVGGAGFERIVDAPRGVRVRTRRVGDDLEIVTDFRDELVPLLASARAGAG